jgi:hypothetical protein
MSYHGTRIKKQSAVWGRRRPVVEGAVIAALYGIFVWR